MVLLWYNNGRLLYDHYYIERRAIMLQKFQESGQGLIEYALILVLVSVVVIVVLALLGPAIGDVFSNIMAAI